MLDGISLTVAKTGKNNFSVSIIPHTAGQTVLSSKKIGDIVNIESDIIGKYVEKLMNPISRDSIIDMKFLSEGGFL